MQEQFSIIFRVANIIKMVNKQVCAIGNKTIIFLGIFGVLFIGGGLYAGYEMIPEVIQNRIWEVIISD